MAAQRILFVFGTRPEAIKLAPLVLHMRARREAFDVRVCVTAQHRQMLDQVLEVFGIRPNHDLDLMRPGQDLAGLTARVITSLVPVVREVRPDWVLVQGDTTTVWAAALVAFYEGVRVGHVEAGLRTFDKRQPFPEEANRRLCSVLADLHFAPTDEARRNLLAEGVQPEAVAVTGNTVIDALLWMARRIEQDPPVDVRAMQAWADEHLGRRAMVLITGHRRESFGEGFENICRAIADLAERYPEVQWVYPVHLNPNVREPVGRILEGRGNIHLLEPQAYGPFVYLMQRSGLILTDSGGVQEEAPSLGKPVLVMRNTTERPEGVAAGCVRLVGNRRERIVEAVSAELDAQAAGAAAPPAANPYGDGHACQRIADAIVRAAGGAGA